MIASLARLRVSRAMLTSRELMIGEPSLHVRPRPAGPVGHSCESAHKVTTVHMLAGGEGSDHDHTDCLLLPAVTRSDCVLSPASTALARMSPACRFSSRTRAETIAIAPRAQYFPVRRTHGPGRGAYPIHHRRPTGGGAHAGPATRCCECQNRQRSRNGAPYFVQSRTLDTEEQVLTMKYTGGRIR